MIAKLKQIDYSKLLLIFLYLQPILDILYGVSFNYLKISISINTIVRFLFMLIAIVYLLLQKKNKIIKIPIGLILFYLALFSINVIARKDNIVLFYELKNMLQLFFFPICLLLFINIKDKINIKDRHFFYLNLIYLFFIFVPDILGLGFSSYSEYKKGFIGWFYSSNSVGTIITILAPLSIYYLVNKKKYFQLIVYVLFITYLFLSLGTKAPILGLGVIGSLLLLYAFIHLLKTKKYKYIIISIPILILFAIAAVFLTPKTAAYKNLKMHLELFEIYTAKDAIKSEVFWDEIVFSQRFMFLDVTKDNYKKSDVPTKLLGLGFVENYNQENENRKTIEIDYLDIFYRSGIVGTIIYLISIIIAMMNIIKSKIIINYNNYSIFISVVLAFVLAFFCGHVLTSPAVSIIISYLLINVDLKEKKTLK